MSSIHPLSQLQRWMMAVITHAEGVQAGLAGEAAQREIAVAPESLEQVINRSESCTSEERLAVYSHAYFARLMECLRAEYPVFERALGEEMFASLAAGYLQQYPSTSYTLGNLGAKFPQYLQEVRPPRTGTEPDWADLLVELVTLERLYGDVFDGPGEEREVALSAEALQQISPADWGELRFLLSRSLRLLDLQFPVQEYFAALRASADAPPPRRRPVLLLVNRRNYVVRHEELTQPQWELLQELQAGATLFAALEATVESLQLDLDQLLPDLERWFRIWTATGVIRGVGR